jgi:hypothetical protein
VSTDTTGSAWTGWVLFGAAVMFIVGAIDIIQGIVALTKDGTYLIAESGLLVTTDFTAWGWSLIIWGAILVVASLALVSGTEWGRWFGIAAVIVNMIVQITWFPAFPLWSLVAVGFGVVVLHALTAGWEKAKADLRR